MDMVLSDYLARLLHTAIFAHSVDLKGVTSGSVVVLASDLLLQVVHFRREELHRAAALTEEAAAQLDDRSAMGLGA